MPKVALADTLVDWDSLIAAARRRVAKNPEITPVLEALERLRDRSKALKAERESLQARRQVATQELRQAREEGKDYAIRLRSVLNLPSELRAKPWSSSTSGPGVRTVPGRRRAPARQIAAVRLLGGAFQIQRAAMAPCICAARIQGAATAL